MEGALEKLPSGGKAVSELGVIEGQINSSEGITHEVVEDFSNVSWITEGIKFTM